VEYQRFGDRYQLRLHPGDRLMPSLTALLKQERIGYAALSGLGAVSQVVLGYYDAAQNDYERHEISEQMEALSLIGNASTRDGEPALHIHAAFARRDLTVIGGHVFEAHTNPTLEIWLRVEDATVQRVYNEQTHLALFTLPDRLDAPR
jgi:predicted DNA-binding protein with PD1-like motif